MKFLKSELERWEDLGLWAVPLEFPSVVQASCYLLTCLSLS